MKRSFDSSFVTGNGDDNVTTRPRSLHRRTATLATHPFHVPEDIQIPNYYMDQPMLTPRYMPDEYEHGPDFQSNVWYQPTSGSTLLWNRIAPGRRPLAGLGITFGSHGNATSSYLLASPPVLAPFLRSPAPSSQPALTVARDNPPCSYAPQPVQREFRDPHAAYSDCPSTEFVAHTPAAPLVPFSPPDNFCMLVDSPALAEPSPMKDKPIYTNAGIDISMLSMESPKSPVIGLFADVNYRALSACKSPVLGVNPEDLTGDGPGLREVSCHETTDANDILMDDIEPSPFPATASTTDSPELQADFPEEALSAIVAVLAESAKQEQSSSRQLPVNAAFRLAPAPAPGFALQPPPYASRTLDDRAAASSSVFRRPFLMPARTPLAPVQPRNLADESPGPIQRPTPILNAHKGVDIEVLRSCAETFRRINPGCELDKTFLQMFAGRLSEDGDSLPEFRCYVKGCCQTNKRRDHILVHVGSHVEHRPFQCDECGMRFLRKNECKRHMSSHVGVKPFTCPICAPYQEKSFVRQDLLKRHMKVTHGAVPEQWPDGRRKRARLMEAKSPKVEEDGMSLDE